MNKVLKLLIIFFVVVFTLLILVFISNFLGRKSATNSLPDYYKNLAKDCDNKTSYSCCIASVKKMKTSSGIL
jgi:NADH:ubiquinone oxidoreductase subunit 3 (subunit A)